jgi:hypothetical protein
MLPHPAHLTGVTQNCTSFLNPSTALTWDPAIYHVVEVYILNKLDHDNILLIVGLIISGVVLVSYASVKSEKEENMY